MRNWLKRFVRGTKPALPAEGDPAREYLALLERRLGAAAPSLARAFDAVAIERLPKRAARIHVEVFDDDPGLSVQAFAYDAEGAEVFSERTRDTSAEGFGGWQDAEDPLDVLNAALDPHFPLIGDEEMAAFWAWERGPEGQRQLALNQPIDRADLRPLLRRQFGPVTGGLAKRFAGRVTVGLHDRDADLLTQR